MSENETDPGFPIFHDPRGRRWPRLRRVFALLGAIVAALLIVGAASVLTNPLLPRFDLPPVRGLPQRTEARPSPPPPRPASSVSAGSAYDALRRAEAKIKLRPARRPKQIQVPPPPKVAPAPLPAPGGPPLVAGFYVNWDDSSYSSLKRNLARLDWVIPEWIRLQPDAARRAQSPIVTRLDPRALDLVRREKPAARVVPLLQNYHDDRWDGALASALLGDAATRARLVAAIVDSIAANGFGGVVVDFAELPADVQPALLAFLGELRGRLRPRGQLLGEAVPFDDDDWSYPAHAAATDYLFLMAYDEHYSTGKAGPVASQPWFESRLAARLRELSPARTIVCIGGYGYDWDDDTTEADVISYPEAMRIAASAKSEVRFDAASRNPTIEYRDDTGSRHHVWFFDAVTAWNQVRAGRRAGVLGFALWRLGEEDPSLWRVFEPGAKPADLAAIQFPYDVDFDGSGELLQAISTPQPGRREVEIDGDAIKGERYAALPSSYVVRRSGDRPGLIALTFDDGPDRRYTPAILDILKREGVRASFFLIGEKAAAAPDLLRRIVAEGHDLGNHTYTHPNLGEASPFVTDLELNATQRLFESITGRGTTLFRAPYFGDAEPQTPDEVEPIFRAQRLGYVAVGLRIDPDDWETPGADEIVRRTLARVDKKPDDDEPAGHVILLHDGGGDRSQTVDALPRIIQGLRARGLKLVPVSELAGLTRDQAMPPVPQNERIYRLTDGVLAWSIAAGAFFLRWLFLVGLVLGFARVAAIAVLALIQKIRRGPPAAGIPERPLRISILVPAYNEEKVIARTVESLLASTWPDFEILIIDDGSKDGTYRVVRERFGDEARVRAYTKPNGGKAAALAFGLSHAAGEIIVALDADTIFPPEVLGELVAPFADPRVAAVAGNAKVGNRINLVTRWQALEYIASQNLDRRAFDLLDCITVVPGAVGAWRRDVLESLGGFHSDTLAEDQDLTIKVRRLGHRVAYAERAVAWTEAPDTIRALAKQRFRWSFGTLQCMWKHRGALFRSGTLGWIAMPNVWIFQILFPLFAPLVDLLLVGALAWALLERIEHPAAGALGQLEPVLFYYALFLVVDWASAAFAFLLERKEQWSLLFWFLLQRVSYRQVMYGVMIKSVLAALRGGLVGWGKLERKATVVAG